MHTAGIFVMKPSLAVLMLFAVGLVGVTGVELGDDECGSCFGAGEYTSQDESEKCQVLENTDIVQGDIPKDGEPYTMIAAGSMEVCCRLCRESSACTYATYQDSTDECYLKNPSMPTVKTREGFVALSPSIFRDARVDDGQPPEGCCQTCDAVREAYSNKGWGFDENKISTCGGTPDPAPPP